MRKSDYVLEWDALAPLLVHPTRVHILEALRWIDQPLSASELQRVLDGEGSLAAISYHLETLRRWRAGRPS